MSTDESRGGICQHGGQHRLTTNGGEHMTSAGWSPCDRPPVYESRVTISYVVSADAESALMDARNMMHGGDYELEDLDIAVVRT